MLTLITGPDAFLVRGAVRRIRAVHDPDGINSTTIDARSSTLDEILRALATPGFFGTGRLIIVNDLMTLAAKGVAADSDEEQSGRTGKVSVDWARVFGAIQTDNVAVFVDQELAGVPATVKRALPAGAEVITGDPPRGSALVSWMKERAGSAGSRLADIDARFLAELLCPSTWSAKPTNPAYDRAPDLELFAGEIDKLALSAYPGAIERAYIVEMTAAAQPDRIFPLIDATIAAEGTQAVRELSSAIRGGDEASRIATQLIQQAELVTALSVAGKIDPIEVGRALGLPNPNRMLAVAKSLPRTRRSRPDALLNAMLDTERQFKTGVLRQPVDQLYALVDRALDVARRTREGGT